MNSMTFKCEVVMPMFLAGADGQTPELRPPSIKGAMRFWWRAMHGNMDITQLREKEAKIFGGGGEDARRSSVIIKTTHPEWDGQFKEYLLPHKGKGNSKAFNPIMPQFFEISFSLTHMIQDFDLDKLESLFVLTCLLGGFGKRSRRGFGSIRIKEIKEHGEAEFKSFCMPKKLQEILDLIRLFSSYYKLDNSSNPLQICPIPSSSFLGGYPYIEKIQVGNSVYTDYKGLVHKVGVTTHDFKSNDPSLGYARRQDRFASPVYVSAIKYGPKDYRAIITTLHMAEKNHKVANQKKQDDFKNAIL